TDLLPDPPTLNANEVRTLSRTVALVNPFDLDDAARDEIVEAMKRGRERMRALPGQPAGLEPLAAELGLDALRQRVIAWVIANDSAQVLDYFSLAEVLVAGRPRADVHLDGWGPSALALTGCLCPGFDVPRWHAYTGRVSMGVLGARLADVTLRLAELTAEAGLPAQVIPDILDAAMQ